MEQLGIEAKFQPPRPLVEAAVMRLKACSTRPCSTGLETAAVASQGVSMDEKTEKEVANLLHGGTCRQCE